MWKDIDTAPKNKTIDLWYENIGRVSECVFRIDSWQTRIWDGSFRVISVEEPTYWMNIPEAPIKKPIKKEAIEQQKRVIEDINERSLEVVGFVCEHEDEKIQILSYDSNGLVKFISKKVEKIKIYGDKGGFTELICVTTNKD